MRTWKNSHYHSSSRKCNWNHSKISPHRSKNGCYPKDWDSKCWSGCGKGSSCIPWGWGGWEGIHPLDSTEPPSSIRNRTIWSGDPTDVHMPGRHLPTRVQRSTSCRSRERKGTKRKHVSRGECSLLLLWNHLILIFNTYSIL